MKKPSIIEKDQLILAGLNFFGDPFRSSAGWTEENEIGRTWQRFMALLHTIKADLPPFKKNCSYELHILHPQSIATGEFEIFVGMELLENDSMGDSPPAELPVEMCIKALPPSTYAIFELKGEEISSDWNCSMQQWMQSAGYSEAHPFSFQRYDERFKGLDRIEESVIEVFLPVKPCSER